MDDLDIEKILGDCQGQTFWVLAPHPDDEVFGCGGTLALLVAQKARVVVDIVSDGAYGKFGEDPALRVSESQAAAAVLGYASPRFWNFPDQGLRFGEGLIQHLLARLQELQPRAVFIPSVWETHPDHLAVCAAAREAIRLSGRAVDVWMYEVGQALRPNTYIDITSVIAQKKQAMACFASQLQVQAYDRHISALNAYRSYQLPATVLAAEAFHRLDPLMLDAGGSVLDSLLEPPAIRQAAQPEPLVSVLIRSSNRPELLQALRSVGEQTYSNIEICVVNATGTAHVALPTYAGTRPIRFLDGGKPLGRSEAANVLLENAQGAYALFLDDDDWLMPGHIAALVRSLQTQPTALAAYADTVCVEQDREGNWREVRRFEGDVSIGSLPFDNKLPIHAVLFRRQMVEQLRFDTAFDLFEDWDWWLQLTRQGAFVHVPGISAIYRIHTAGGEGVRADPGRSRAALEQIVNKWHVALPIDQAVERLAYVRQVIQALFAEQRQSTALRQELDVAKRQMEQVVQGYETAIAQQEKENHGASQQIVQMLTDMQQAMDDMQRLSAWSFPGILRRIKRRVQGYAQPQRLRSENRTTVAFAMRVKNNATLRKIYYRLPLADEQRFRLRTWIGRWLATSAETSASPASLGVASGASDAAPTKNTHQALLITRPALLADTATFDGARATWPTVSVIIPCYNQWQFLHDSVGSAMAAYQGPLDIVVIDDGSTDPITLRCLGDMQKIHPSVRVIQQANGGLSAARNAGLEQARGDYIQFLDADDLLVPGKLDAQVQQMQAMRCDIALCNYLVANHELTEYARHEETINISPQFDLQTFLFKWERGLTIPIHCALFSKKILTNVRFLTMLKAKEDWVFWCALAHQQAVFAYCDFNGVIYRMHQGSMRRSFVSMGKQWLQAVAYIDGLYGQQFPGFFDASVDWLQQYYVSHPYYQEEIKLYRQPS